MSGYKAKIKPTLRIAPRTNLALEILESPGFPETFTHHEYFILVCSLEAICFIDKMDGQIIVTLDNIVSQTTETYKEKNPTMPDMSFLKRQAINRMISTISLKIDAAPECQWRLERVHKPGRGHKAVFIWKKRHRD